MIKVERPPNFAALHAAFPDADKPGVIFAYGPDIYAPSGGEIPNAILRHESVHQQRQLVGVMTQEIWWSNYLAGAEFRYHEELLAHAVEYTAQLHSGITRNDRAKLLMSTARRLIAPLYNYVPPRSLAQAMRDLTQEIDRV
jgi:hypothetical protein